MKSKLPMYFDPKQDRWCVEREGWEYDLHCGACVEIYIGGEPIPCQLEWSRDWYVILKDVRFILRQSDQYDVNY